MTTINDISDLVRILQEKPEWAETLRGALLSKELLDLPDTFAKFIKTHQEQMTAIYGRLDALEQGQTRLEEGQARLERTVNSMRGEIGNLSGSNYQRQTAAVSDRIAERDFNLRDTTLIHHADRLADSGLKPLINTAVKDPEIQFDQNDAFDLTLADAVICGTGPEGDTQYILAEVSVTADPDDVGRAARRAGLLAIATSAPVLALVITAYLPEDSRDAAAKQQVYVSIVPVHP